MCEICHQNICPCGCPNYKPKKMMFYCSVCDNAIQDGERYIENEYCDYAHFDCLRDLTTRELLDWVGLDEKVMEVGF